ncbi:MAG TPA: hypothetical protein PK513_07380 [Alphaproteobacteria bacterium]|nr:hypothetical protein [Alphaproteobacteria bacterium]USO04797.1 MAG: hypothetical protein H6859_06425 [Rhodospirillales bacterium]HOO82305.1 hypothetical protein [Alphaproteobacteria bacterium]
MEKDDKDVIRLSDRILSALELALEQNDLKISELLTRALEQAMTRNTGGGEFIERRDYPPEIERAMDKLCSLRDQNDGI